MYFPIPFNIATDNTPIKNKGNNLEYNKLIDSVHLLKLEPGQQVRMVGSHVVVPELLASYLISKR